MPIEQKTEAERFPSFPILLADLMLEAMFGPLIVTQPSIQCSFSFPLGQDKTNKRYMLLAIDRRKKLLKYLRRTRYEVFENVCTQLGVQYTFPPEYYRKATQRWVAKKALCLKVWISASCFIRGGYLGAAVNPSSGRARLKLSMEPL